MKFRIKMRKTRELSLKYYVIQTRDSLCLDKKWKDMKVRYFISKKEAKDFIEYILKTPTIYKIIKEDKY